MFADENEGGGFFSSGGQLGTSFAKLEKKAADDTSRMLREVQSQLYDSPICITPPPAKPSLAGGTDGEGYYGGFGADMGMVHIRRFADNEYEAHTDAVKPQELKDWQDSFSFLRVAGTSMSNGNRHIDDDDDDDDDGNSDGGEGSGSGSMDESLLANYECVPAVCTMSNGTQAFTSASGNTAIRSGSGGHSEGGELLSVRGNAAVITTLSKGCVGTCPSPEEESDGYINADGEEVFMQHGVLVDTVLERHMPVDPTASANNNDDRSACDMHTNTALEPAELQQAEVISILADAVWPDVVSQLKPLVLQVVGASQLLGLDFYEKQHEEREGDRDRQRRQAQDEDQHTKASDGESLFDHGW